MKRVVLAIRNRLILEAVTNALKRAGFFVENLLRRKLSVSLR